MLRFRLSTLHGKPPLVIGHRGAAGHRPEHTIASSSVAIDYGVNYIEPDLVSTKDGVLIARHENDISLTTDVVEKFPQRRATKVIDSKQVVGYFTEGLHPGRDQDAARQGKAALPQSGLERRL